MTPESFTTNALAWLTAIGAVLFAVCALAAKVLPSLAALWQAVNEMRARQDRQGEKINTAQAQIVSVAQSVPPAVPLEPATTLYSREALANIVPGAAVAKLEVGSVARLNRGGQKMTVEAVRGDAIACVWFEGSTLRHDVFPAAALSPVDKDEPEGTPSA